MGIKDNSQISGLKKMNGWWSILIPMSIFRELVKEDSEGEIRNSVLEMLSLRCPQDTQPPICGSICANKNFKR